jgi:hypothetical protein
LNDEAVQACPPSRGYRLRKFVWRNKAAVLAGVAMAVLRCRVPRLREVGACPPVVAEPPASDLPGVTATK